MAVREERTRRATERERERISNDLIGIRQRCSTLAGFVREAWPIVEPNNAYVHGWHIDVICDHLEAVSLGMINRLLTNIPSGMMKSLLLSVMWPAWEWGPGKKPHMRYLASSYSDGIVSRDSRRMRDLVMSDWYQLCWPEVKLTRFGETSFENTETGFREGRPMKSMTGGRGDRVIIDDPHSTETAESEAERVRTTRIFRESITSRLNDVVKSAIVVIMQRLHEKDVSGVILDDPTMRREYQHLMLPMEYEPERRCRTILGVSDYREHDGELLFPERFPRAQVDRDKAIMGSYGFAGQMQQRPAPREGGMFKRQWFEIVGAVPAGTRWVRHWDLAATRKMAGNDPDHTCGLKLGRAPDGIFYIGDVRRCQEEGPEVRRLIRHTAAMDGKEVEISLPQEPGQAGKTMKRDMILMLAGFNVHAELETGDKATRAEPVAAQAEAGNVKIVKNGRDSDWIEPFLDEVTVFPAGAHDDQADSLSGAFGRLTMRRVGSTTTGLLAGMI